MVHKHGKMVLNLRVIGEMDRQTVKAPFYIQMEIFIMANLDRIERTVTEYTFIKTVRNMRVSGKTMFKKDKVKKY